jgi:hypothetical protein
LVVAAICAGVLVDGWFWLPLPAVPARGPDGWANVTAVVELPTDEPAVDFGAIYRAMSHGRPIVNGYSGYDPPHYLPLGQAIREHEYTALQELASYGSIGIAVDRTRPDSGAVEAEIAALAGVQRVQLADGWATFVAPQRPVSAVRPGPMLPISSVRGNRHEEDLGRLLDGTVETGWGSGGPQRGDEILVVDLGSVRPVGALILDMGSFAFGFPRRLTVEVSADGSHWSGAWNGGLSVLTVRAALAEPSIVPVTLELGRVAARFLRLRQLGHDASIPWWIAELEVRGPPENSGDRQ